MRAIAFGLSLVLAAVVLADCAADLRPPEADPQVVLAISMVPADVACVRLSVAGGGRALTREVDVMPGGTVEESFGGLPFGTLDFGADAFPGTCAAVTKATVPAWVSDPAQAAVALGRIANVSLTLHRNGRAKVSLDFSDEPACLAPGAACLGATQCCSHSCARGACQPPDAGADQD